MKKELMRVSAIAALVLLVVGCMASCGESAKQDEAVTDETKGSAVTSVAENAKKETAKEPGKVDQSFIWPVAGFERSLIGAGFGQRIHPIFGTQEFHSGVDIEANVGDKALASANGKVVKAEWYGGYGMCVIIEHKDGVQTLYGHLSEILVKKDAEVKKGDTVGLAGSTGVSTGPQIHFEVKVKDKNDKNGEYHAVDPVEFMKN